MVRSKLGGHLQEAEEILQQLAEEQPVDSPSQHQHHQHRVHPQADLLRELLRPLPKAPVEFPASAAWDYLVTAQGKMSGVDQLDAIVRRMRGRVEVRRRAGPALTAVRVSMESPTNSHS